MGSLVLIIIWAFFAFAIETLIFSTNRFSAKLEESAPEVWEQFHTGSDDLKTLDRQRLSEYVWKKEYEQIGNTEITRLGNRARAGRTYFAVAGSFLVIYYLAPYLLRN